MPADHLLRSIDRFVDLSGLREQLRPFDSETGRPSIDPELIIRMLLVGYCFGIRSERRLCEEVHLCTARRPHHRHARSSQLVVGVLLSLALNDEAVEAETDLVGIATLLGGELSADRMTLSSSGV